MLFFAVWIRRNARSIFEVELPMPHRRGAFEGFAHRGKARGNASVFLQESMNGAGRFWQPQLPYTLILKQAPSTRGRSQEYTGAYGLSNWPGKGYVFHTA